MTRPGIEPRSHGSLAFNERALGVIDIVVGNGHGDPSSNPTRSYLHIEIKVWIPLFFLLLWVNRADWAL